MRAIERTSAFKKDYKRAQANPRHKNLEALLANVLMLLLLDRPLAEKRYTKPDVDTLRLVRLGTDSDLF